MYTIKKMHFFAALDLYYICVCSVFTELIQDVIYLTLALNFLFQKEINGMTKKMCVCSCERVALCARVQIE